MRTPTELDEFRAAKDEFFRQSPDSPLEHEQRHQFTGLRYYAPDDALRFELRLDTKDAGSAEEIGTSKGTSERMIRAGRFAFELDGNVVSLTAFAQEGQHSLFVPFRDATGQTETYPAGRYVEAEPESGGKWILDFNRAYNPFCAYNDAWRCPLPPMENWLDAEIRAGEKRFHDRCCSAPSMRRGCGARLHVLVAGVAPGPATLGDGVRTDDRVSGLLPMLAVMAELRLTARHVAACRGDAKAVRTAAARTVGVLGHGVVFGHVLAATGLQHFLDDHPSSCH